MFSRFVPIVTWVSASFHLIGHILFFDMDIPPFCMFIHQLMDICTVSTLGPIWIMPHWASIHKFLCERMFSFPLVHTEEWNIYPYRHTPVHTWDQWYLLCLTFGRRTGLFSKWLPFYIPLRRYGGVLIFFHVLTNTCYHVDFWLWPFYGGWSGISSHCGFGLLFLDK